QFIQTINEWFKWFDRFIDIFQHVIDWMKKHNVKGSNQLLIDLLRIRDDPKMTVTEIKKVIEGTLNILKPFKDLRCLCQLFNCLIPFQITNPGTLNPQEDATDFLDELKRFNPNNTFIVECKKNCEKTISITDNQQVQWSLVSGNYPSDILVEYRNHGAHSEYMTLFDKPKVPVHKNALHGQFESLRSGQLLISVTNTNNPSPVTIWYRIKSTGLSSCYLFHGIFNMNYDKYCQHNPETISENEFSALLDQVFLFIKKLLSGEINLRAMTELQTIFKDKNINIREEVKRLFITCSNKQDDKRANKSTTEQEIEQVCEWLQIYQYYSHLNIIMECLEKFDLLASDEDEETISRIKSLSENENCSLKEITEAYQILKECFQRLTHQHLQLIKTVVECSNVISMMKKSDLYSQNGRRRFQELRDNLTTQFQMQELNNMILNSWIITYALIEPFMFKAKNFDEFIVRLAQLKNIDENSLNHIKVVNDNIQLVTIWLSADETAVLDNALITMDHLFKTGTVSFHLRRLTRQQSCYEMGYSIDRFQGEMNMATRENIQAPARKISFTLSMSDIDDHKRQLTFCNVDVKENAQHRKYLIEGQLELLKVIGKIYHIFIKLELVGHPDYQLRDQSYDIGLHQTQVGSLLANQQSHVDPLISNAIRNRIQNLETIYTSLKAAHDRWIQCLKKHRESCQLLKLFSNHEIMILIILLRTSNTLNPVRIRFLKQIFEFKTSNEQQDIEQKFAIHCLEHYLRSLRISQENLSIDHLYDKHQIKPDTNIDSCLTQLSKFFDDAFQNKGKIFQERQMHDENEQYIVRINRSSAVATDNASFLHDLDLNTCCILLNIFQNQLPASYQILWCTNATEDNVNLFFSRIRTFPALTFVIMDIDKMQYRLREILLNEQYALTQQQDKHGRVFYFSHELTVTRKGLREFPIPAKYKDPFASYHHILDLFKKHKIELSDIHTVYGTAGIGKTHRINKEYKNDHTSCFSINDKLNVPLLISSFLSSHAKMMNSEPSIFFNISIHAPFEALNRALFSLVICGCLTDPESGLIFSLPHNQSWNFIIEVPYSDARGVNVHDNYNQILPIIAIMSPSNVEEITDENYQLFIGEEEELVARFLKAFENKSIDRKAAEETSVSFESLTNPDECRTYIYNCIRQYASNLPKDKIYQLSLTKFLYRRFRFFQGFYYCMNETIDNLGSTTMKQMINEAVSLAQVNFRDSNYPRTFLVYDPSFSLHLLHGDWNLVSPELKTLFNNCDPFKSKEYIEKDYYAECLSWVIDIKYQVFMGVVKKTKFILTENFAYKLLHVHERKLTKMALIIEGDTGVGLKESLIESLRDYITLKISSDPLLSISSRLANLLEEVYSPTIDMSIEMFKEYLFYSELKSLFYRLLLHPGISEEQVVEFMTPICALARQVPDAEIVVFFDEVNTSSCLGLFKEMFVDRTLHGTSLPENIFFTAAINPFIKIDENTTQVHRSNYIVHDLPQSLKHLKVSYGPLEHSTLANYIVRKIAMFQLSSSKGTGKTMPLEKYFQETLANSILKAQEFCEKNLGQNSVSQREIQRCFNMIDFFWTLRYDDELKYDQNTYSPNPMRCIALSIALIYYFRLPTKEDNLKRKDDKTPSREQLADILRETIPEFDRLIQRELENFVNTNNFVFPQGVAINQAVREHVFAIVISIATRTPLSIIGEPGQSKTLSFQIVVQNLQGAQLSSKPFCKRLPAVDPFYSLGSKYTQSDDIASVFDRAIRREQQYEQNRINTRCVVFLDEASLPDEKKMVLKVLHPYLDDCQVAFVAVANKAFDAANANRMICIYRSLPSKDDQKILAYGCLGLQNKEPESVKDDRLAKIVSGLCQGYREVLQSPDIPHIFHDRDFIYMLRELRFELINVNEVDHASVGEITPRSLLQALEDNFNGIRMDEFGKLVNIFSNAVAQQSPQFRSLITEKQKFQRNVPTILRSSMKLDPVRRRLYGRYKLIIDESEDESAVRLLFQLGILHSDRSQTTVFRMSDFPNDIDNELRSVEILSEIKLCMETGKTILMINTGRVHGSLYDVFNQNFSIMATEDSRKIFSKVTIGSKTIDVIVHEDFQCIVHIKRSEFKEIPAPFLSRFQKFSFSVSDFYSIQLKQIPIDDQKLLNAVETKARSFIEHFGREYFYGFNNETLCSCLLSFIENNDKGEPYLSNIHENYTQLTIQSKSYIEEDTKNKAQCFLYAVISKMLQIASPESMIFKLPTFEESTSRGLCQNYFYQQEHFNIGEFVSQLISSPVTSTDENELLTLFENTEQNKNNIGTMRKLMIFTRTSSFVNSLNKQSKHDLFRKNDENDMMMNIGDNVDIINLAMIENSNELDEQVQNFKEKVDKSVLIFIIDGRINQQRIHIPFVRQLIDKVDLACNDPSENLRKFFIILMHSSGQELNHKSCFSSIFLDEWDYWFLDTSAPGSAFHLQKMLQIFTSKIGLTHQREPLDKPFYDVNMLFDDCLWDFCSRLQINVHKLSEETMFHDRNAFEFYQIETTIPRRVQCLKNIFQQINEFQKYIITSYHENVSMKEDSLRKNCNSIYELAKDTLAGKQLTGFVDSLQSRIRVSFTQFASYILKNVIDDYGLGSLIKLSNKDSDYIKLLQLIDCSSFSGNNENQTGSLMMQGMLILNDRYSCVPQTPLFYLCQQRIKTLADEIKSKLANQKNQLKEQVDGLNFDDDLLAPATTAMEFNNDMHDDKDQTREQFCTQLVRSIMHDKVLTKILSSATLQSFTSDSIRIHCTIIEKNFYDNQIGSQKTMDFVSKWLMLADENERTSLDSTPNRDIWQLAHVYGLLEYDQNDILSLYSACRIAESLDSNKPFYENVSVDEQGSRSKVRENLFQSMFRHLWTNICVLCRTNKDAKQWIHNYALITKYYPSDNVLQGVELMHMKVKIEFMNLIYLILLNGKTPQPIQLIQQLLKDTGLMKDDIDVDHLNLNGSSCLKLLSTIIQTINRYFEQNNANNGTLMMDIQHWILSTLKGSKKSSQQEIISLLKILNEPSCHLSLPMKQFLFDELFNILIENSPQNRREAQQQFNDFWDRTSLLSVIMDCVTNENLENYQIPYHPSVITNENQNHVVLDLFFFHLRRLANSEKVTIELINKILLATSPLINNPNQINIVEKLFMQLKEYFVLQTTASFLCDSDINDAGQQRIAPKLNAIIAQYLIIQEPYAHLSSSLQLFCTTIITKRSWNFLFDLLKSELIQRVNAQWADKLHSLFASNVTVQRNRHLNFSHQIQFTLTTDTTSSIFPTLHQPYDELNQLINQCVKNNDPAQRWIPLTNWIRTKLTANPLVVNAVEIKVMILLNIYYNYYCNAQLNLLDNLLTVIENTLQPCEEEKRVFRAFLQPEQYMIGYPTGDNAQYKNYLNDLFEINFQDDKQLPMRHTLVNLLAMILLGGKENTLWMFAFDPLKLEGTYGFGSTATSPIQRNGVHYDCGCVINERGELEQLHGGNQLNVPAVYVVFFATYGAMAWHLLLFQESVDNLYHPILAKHAVDPTAVDLRVEKTDLRGKVCYFVCTRLLATNMFLETQRNQDDACLLYNRCFELFAQFTRQLNQYPWIKPLYTNNNEKLLAENEFQSKIFYVTQKKLDEYKKTIDCIQSQSDAQTKLQNFITEKPIIIENIHFRIELCSPESSLLPLTILRRLLESFEILKMTRYIYALAQFHILLHRTFTQLIEQEEFYDITLNEVYKRASQSRNPLIQISQEEKYRKIIDNGIEAFNAYHKFTNGQIRPGACDITQGFETISIDTPIGDLVETENYDQGNFVMRILSTLIACHNNLLILLERELSTHEETLDLGPLKDMIHALSEREISILQITNDNMGVITLNNMNCQWIEKLTRASLENEKDYFLKFNTPLKFNFLYVQSYLIRTYILYCPINYQQIKGKYQCCTRKKLGLKRNCEININDDYLLANEWNHLENKSYDQLLNESNFLERIMDILNESNEDYSSMNLLEFIQNKNYSPRFAEQYEKFGMKDFSLSKIKNVYQLYQQAINQLQHAYANVPHLIRIPLTEELNNALDDKFKSLYLFSCDQIKKEEYQAQTRSITELLNDFKDIEDFVERESSKSLIETCRVLSIESPILALISEEIKCENYVPICLKLIEIRSKLQEKIINIEEQTTSLWNARLDSPVTDQSKENSFNLFRKKDNIDDNDFLRFDSEPDSHHESDIPIIPEIKDPFQNVFDWLSPDLSIDELANPKLVPSQSNPGEATSEPVPPEPYRPESASLLQLNIKLTSSPASTLFTNCQDQLAQKSAKTPNKRFSIPFKDGKLGKYMCGPEKFYEKLKSIFTEKKYDSETLAIIDRNQIFIDFMAEKKNNILPVIEEEYSIIEKSLLIPIILEFQNEQYQYYATSEAKISAILIRFIVDQELAFNTNENYFSVFDSFKQYIAEDCQINNMHRLDPQRPISVQISQCNEKTNIFCQVTFTKDETHNPYFNPSTTWKQLSLWLKNHGVQTENSINGYYFWHVKQQLIIDGDHTIASTLDQSESVDIDVISEDSVTDIILSYDKISQTIRILKSCSVRGLLGNSNYLTQLNLKVSREDCTLVFVSNAPEKQILNDSDMDKSIEYYASMTDKPVHFQISILIQIIRYNDQTQIPLPLSHRNLTIKDLLEMIEAKDSHMYLASCETKLVLSNNMILSTINETKFFLVKESQTCLVSIEQSKDVLLVIDDGTMRDQRYIIDATMNDVYQHHKNIGQDQYLSYNNDIAPSRDTSLRLFINPTTLSVVFNITYEKPEAHVTVESDEQQEPIRFQCSPSMSFGRLHEIVCQLWKLKKNFYSTTLSDESIPDEDCSLTDTGESLADIRLKIISTTDTKCKIEYQNTAILISTTNETLLKSILDEALEKLLIPRNAEDSFKFCLLDDPDNPTEVDLDSNINDMRSILPPKTDTIPLLLEKLEN
ncbi:unnamed protein product, partial [Rotaria magnacalcarata]